MRGNPTTGYEWKASEEHANGAFEIERTYIMDKNPGHNDDEVWAGVGGTYYFTVTAPSNGQSDELFHIWHARSFESENEAMSVIEFPIHVY